MANSRNAYLEPDPEFLIETGAFLIGTDERAVEKSSLEKEGEDKAATANARKDVVSRFATGQIKFANALDVPVVVFATAEKDTRNLYNTETAMKGDAAQAVGLEFTRKAVLAYVSQFNIEHVFELEPKGEEGCVSLQYAPRGAEGFDFMWFVYVEENLRFGGRMSVYKGQKIRFVAKPRAIPDRAVPAYTDPGQAVADPASAAHAASEPEDAAR